MLTTYLSTGGWRRKGSRRRRLRRGAGCRGGRHPWVPAAARSVASGSGQRGPWMRSAEAEVPGGTTRRLGGSWRETGREEAGWRWHLRHLGHRHHPALCASSQAAEAGGLSHHAQAQGAGLLTRLCNIQKACGDPGAKPPRPTDENLESAVKFGQGNSEKSGIALLHICRCHGI